MHYIEALQVAVHLPYKEKAFYTVFDFQAVLLCNLTEVRGFCATGMFKYLLLQFENSVIYFCVSAFLPALQFIPLRSNCFEFEFIHGLHK